MADNKRTTALSSEENILSDAPTVAGDDKRTTALSSEEVTLSDVPTVALESEKTSNLLASEMGAIPPLDRRIGAYRLIRELGRGGMGAVYLASRADDQFEKLVAIKVVVRGLDTDFAIQRFRAERQILASLDHPNIARLLDGGTTTDGRPFFVMEYIEGKPIIEYSDENKLSIEDRLKLFRQVCSAVQYSHQNLVIHRDIKPSNILVTAEGVPKLLDFGIAKILNPDLYPLGVDQTQTAMRLMTPQYASPEQARGEPVTTATDVYLLGVLLYELLTGQRPYKITSIAPHEIIRVICDQEPDRPSTAITRITKTGGADDTSSVIDQSAFVSGLGEGSVDKLRRRLAGDLDIIVLKAIRKDPAARYGSVDLLSEDVRRHLEGKPIAARPDTLFYRAGKFIKRNKIPVAAVILIMLSLLGGIIATAWQASVARTQRAKAELRFNEVRKLANTFLFELNDAIKDLPGSTPARELLVKSAVEYLDSLARESSDDPSLQRELAIAYRKIGDLQGNPYFPNLGDMEGALASYKKSVAVSEELVKADSSSTQYRHELALGLEGMGDLMWASGDSAEAIDYYRRAAEYESSVVAADPSNKDARLRLWAIYRSTAYAQAQAGDFDGGVETFNKSREVIEAVVAENPTDPKMRGYLATNYSSLGEVVGEKGDLAGALDYFQKALVIQQELSSAQPTNVDLQIDVGISREKVGDVLDKLGDTKGALDNFAKAMAIFEYVSKADPTNAQASRNVAVEMFNMGRMLVKLGNINEALAHYRKSVAITEKLASVEGANLFVRAGTAITHSHIGIALAMQGDETTALEHSSKGVEIVEALLKENPENAEIGGVVANAYYDEAEVNFVIAEKGKVTRNRQAELWKRARDYYQRSRNILKSLSDRGAWISSDYKLPGDVDQKIAQCEEALAKIGGASGTN
jgi:non-specific serine/threonine protein kinase/serine/threonine-protein kinase